MTPILPGAALKPPGGAFSPPTGPGLRPAGPAFSPAAPTFPKLPAPPATLLPGPCLMPPGPSLLVPPLMTREVPRLAVPTCLPMPGLRTLEILVVFVLLTLTWRPPLLTRLTRVLVTLVVRVPLLTLRETLTCRALTVDRLIVRLPPPIERMPPPPPPIERMPPPPPKLCPPPPPPPRIAALAWSATRMSELANSANAPAARTVAILFMMERSLRKVRWGIIGPTNKHRPSRVAASNSGSHRRGLSAAIVNRRYSLWSNAAIFHAPSAAFA